jgi:hypothetical protein
MIPSESGGIPNRKRVLFGPSVATNLWSGNLYLLFRIGIGNDIFTIRTLRGPMAILRRYAWLFGCYLFLARKLVLQDGEERIEASRPTIFTETPVWVAAANQVHPVGLPLQSRRGRCHSLETASQ